MKPTTNDITIRTALRPGDFGYVTYRHGALYAEEYGYGISFMISKSFSVMSAGSINTACLYRRCWIVPLPQRIRTINR